jgi:hypothetical protein
VCGDALLAYSKNGQHQNLNFSVDNFHDSGKLFTALSNKFFDTATVLIGMKFMGKGKMERA